MKVRKIIKIAIILIIFLNLFVSHSNAGIWSTGKDWLVQGENSDEIDISQAIGKINEISGLLWGIGIVVAVVAVAILGVSFIIASGSEEKANIKKKAITVAIGLLVLFGSVTIWQIVVNLLSSNS